MYKQSDMKSHPRDQGKKTKLDRRGASWNLSQVAVKDWSTHNQQHLTVDLTKQNLSRQEKIPMVKTRESHNKTNQSKSRRNIKLCYYLMENLGGGFLLLFLLSSRLDFNRSILFSTSKSTSCKASLSEEALIFSSSLLFSCEISRGSGGGFSMDNICW